MQRRRYPESGSRSGLIAVRVDHCDNRDTKTLGFLNSNRFLVGVDDEHQVRNRTHVLDATEGAVKLFTLTLKVQAFLLVKP